MSSDQLAVVEVVGVSLWGGAPTMSVDLPMAQGVHALIGRNGAGKTLILERLRAALTGRRASGTADVHIRAGVWTFPFDEGESEPVPGLATFPTIPKRRGQSALVAGIEDALDDELKDLEQLGALTESRARSLAERVEQIVATRLHHACRAARNSADAESINRIAQEVAAQGYFCLTPVGSVEAEFTLWIAARPDGTAPTFHRELEYLDAEWQAHLLRVESLGEAPTDGLDALDELRDQRLAHSPLWPYIFADIETDRVHHEWAPYPLMACGTVRATLEGLSVIGPTDVDPDAMTRSRVQEVVRDPVSPVRRKSTLTAAERDRDRAALAEATLMAIGESAAAVLHNMLIDAPSLCAEVPGTVQLLTEAPSLWCAEDQFGARLELACLSRAQRRLAEMAIAIAVSDHGSDRPEQTVVLFDEPELGLHRLAERRLVRSLDTLSQQHGATVYCATHSPQFIGEPFVSLHHVTRGVDGQIEAIPMSGLQREQLADLGLELADVLQTIRGFLIVEGRHDEIVLNELFADGPDGLSAMGIHLIAMHGGKSAASVVDSSVIWDFTDAQVIVVVDKLPHEVAATAWNEAREFLGETHQAEAAAEMFRNRLSEGMRERVGRSRGDEEKWISALGSRALERGQPERLQIFGFEEDDILAYLDADQLRPGATDWLAAKKKNLKDEDVQRAVAALDHIPEEFLRLHQLLQRVSERSRS